ncbi:MAG: Protein MraZ [Desulfotomaculum sp. 46_80]|nr:MAG: Protein MraZ [Desulfotomaculum sp. 46_80]
MGEYQHTIDDKGRLFIPARFRDSLGIKFVLTKGLDSCLFAYPPQEWTILEEKMRLMPFTSADVRAFVRRENRRFWYCCLTDVVSGELNERS